MDTQALPKYKVFFSKELIFQNITLFYNIHVSFFNLFCTDLYIKSPGIFIKNVSGLIYMYSICTLSTYAILVCDFWTESSALVQADPRSIVYNLLRGRRQISEMKQLSFLTPFSYKKRSFFPQDIGWIKTKHAFFYILNSFYLMTRNY